MKTNTYFYDTVCQQGNNPTNLYSLLHEINFKPKQTFSNLNWNNLIIIVDLIDSCGGFNGEFT